MKKEASKGGFIVKVSVTYKARHVNVFVFLQHYQPVAQFTEMLDYGHNYDKSRVEVVSSRFLIPLPRHEYIYNTISWDQICQQ